MTTKQRRKSQLVRGPGGAEIERRIYEIEWREAVKGSGGRQRWASAVAYGVVDDYGTIWQPRVFTEALDQRMPTMLYGHDWTNLSHVLGKGIDHRETDSTVDVLMEFDDPDFVPMARQAMWQVEHKTLRDVSVGFERHDWRAHKDLTDDELELGAMEVMERAGMDELSLVVRGAVPGAQMRSAGQVDLDAVVAIARLKAAGELTDEEAKAAVELLGGDVEEPTGDDLEDPDAAAAAQEAADQASADEAAAEAEKAADEALDMALSGRSRR